MSGYVLRLDKNGREHPGVAGTSGWSGYVLAVAVVAAGAALRWVMDSILGQHGPFLIFYPCILIAAAFGGAGPGLLATGLSALAGEYLFVDLPVWKEGWAGPEALWLALFLVGGVMVGMLGAFLRASQHKAERESVMCRRVESALRESEERFRSIFNQAAIGICLARPTGEMRMVNQRLCEMLGYSAEELKQRSYKDITYPEDWPAQVEKAQRLMAGEIQSYSMEKRYIRKDGSLVWANLTCSAIREGQPYVVAVIEDISVRKEMEEVLKESEEKFRTLAENAAAAFGIVQGDRFIYANDYFARFSGYSREELLQLSFPKLVHPSFQPMMIERAARRQRGEHVPSRYEFLMVTKSGEERWVDFSPARIMLRGKPAVIGTGYDITERKRAEAALKESEKWLEKAKETAEAASRAKDQFLAVLSHELRTPLTPVLAAVTLMESEAGLTPDARENLEMIRRNVELEARLIDDLLDLTRISRGKLELKPVRVAACKLLRDTLNVVAEDVRAKQLELSIDTGEKSHWLMADPPRLQQVFWNLLKNAVKFTPVGGWIRVRCSDDGNGHVVVEVSDSGVGIEPEVLGRLFGAFEQGSRLVTRQFGGLGLGLAISKALVELHGGTIEAHSAGKGKGSTFRVVLPALDHVGSSDDAVSPPPPVCREDTGRNRILLVEDHIDTARTFRRLLEGRGYKVRLAGTVQQALELAGSERFDLVISDLGLPDGTGLDVMRSLRHRSDVKGIALSGYGMDDDVIRSREAGFAEHLTKPIDLGRLSAVVKEVIDGKG